MAITATSTQQRRQLGIAAQASLGWWHALILVVAGYLIILTIYRDTAISLVDTWSSSSLYGHGFLVLPAAIFLLWQRRAMLKALQPRPSFMGAGILSLSAGAWLVGETASINLLQHFGLVAMLPGVFVSVLGTRIARVCILPLAYLLFAVPFGGEFIPVLQEITGVAVASILVLTGIPALLEANFLIIPNGQFEIAEACAGARFLIATVAIAAFGSDILYSRVWKRLAFLALAIGLAILGNAIRAYLIVAIAAWRGLAAGAQFDHVTFGLVFLSVILVLLFLAGAMFRDGDLSVSPRATLQNGVIDQPKRFASQSVIACAAGLTAVAAPYLGAQLIEPGIVRQAVVFGALESRGTWRSEPQAGPHWQPAIANADTNFSQNFALRGEQITLHISYFTHQRQGAEVVQEGNRYAGSEPWRNLGAFEMHLNIAPGSARVPCSTIDNGTAQRIACHIFWVNGQLTGSTLAAKFHQVLGRLSFAPPAAAVITFSWPPSGDTDADKKLVESLFQSLPPMTHWLASVASPQ